MSRGLGDVYKRQGWIWRPEEGREELKELLGRMQEGQAWEQRGHGQLPGVPIASKRLHLVLTALIPIPISC